MNFIGDDDDDDIDGDNAETMICWLEVQCWQQPCTTLADFKVRGEAPRERKGRNTVPSVYLWRW